MVSSIISGKSHHQASQGARHSEEPPGLSHLTVKVHYKPKPSGACIGIGTTRGDRPKSPIAKRLSRFSQTIAQAF